MHEQLAKRLQVRVVRWRALAEIDAGIYDGYTYSQIEDSDPSGAVERAMDKLHYQYPQGESYKDVIDRLERVLMEIMRCECPIVVIAHQAVIRCLYGYLLDVDLNGIPHIAIPLHHVMTVLPHAYGAEKHVADLTDLTNEAEMATAGSAHEGAAEGIN